MGLDISIVSRKASWNFSLKEKATCLIGDSGSGKTTLIKYILDTTGLVRIHGLDGYKIALITDATWELFYLDNLNRNTKYVFIVDDNDFMYTKYFKEMYSKISNCYFLFIIRGSTWQQSMENIKQFNFSIYETYYLAKEGQSYSFKPYVNLLDFNQLEKSSRIDYCLIEDTGAGFEFVEKLFPGKVKGTGGVSRVLQYIIDNADRLANTRVLVLIDMSAAGAWFTAILQYLHLLNAEVYIPDRDHSLEYVLLKSNTA